MLAVFTNLTFPFNPLRDNIDPIPFFTIALGSKPHARLDVGDLHQGLLNLLHDAGLKPVLVELFYTPPFRVKDIHIDDVGGDLAKLNWQFGGQGSVMKWYEPKPNTTALSGQTPINTAYISYQPHNVILKQTTEVGFPTLVQAGVPHNVVNLGIHHRYCLSVVVCDIQTNQVLGFDEASTRLNIWKSHGESNPAS